MTETTPRRKLGDDKSCDMRQPGELDAAWAAEGSGASGARASLFAGFAAMTLSVAAALFVAALAVVLALAAGGCGGAGGGSASGAPLDGTSWRLTSWSVSSQDPAEFTITAEFAAGRIGGTSGVNSYGGSYAANDDGSFSVGELACTEMAGPEPNMRAEQHYLEILGAATRYRLEGSTLTLSDLGGSRELVFTSATPAE